MSKNKKIGIVSSYKISCGIAAYVHALERYLGQELNIKVIPVDVFIMKQNSKMGRKAAENHLQEIISQASQCDHVNIQYEPGLYGSSYKAIHDRLKRILYSNQSVSITFHTIVRDDYHYGLLKDFKALLKWAYKRHYLYNKVYGTIKQLQKKRRVPLIVHTNRDKRFFEIELGLKDVQAHPLVFYDKSTITDSVKEQIRKKIKKHFDIPNEANLIMLPGFLSPYKGHDTAIFALEHLPENFYLLFAGSVHPNEIQPDATIHPYNDKLLRMVSPLDFVSLDDLLAYAEKKQLKNANTINKSANSQNTLPRDNDILDVYKKGVSLVDRVKFLGHLDDQQFAEIMASSDYVLLPYVETGQTSSGPASMALDLDANLILSNNHCFNELERFAQGAFPKFDIGNHIQLAQIIKTYSQKYYQSQRAKYQSNYNTKSNTEVYKEAINRAG